MRGLVPTPDKIVDHMVGKLFADNPPTLAANFWIPGVDLAHSSTAYVVGANRITLRFLDSGLRDRAESLLRSASEVRFSAISRTSHRGLPNV